MATVFGKGSGLLSLALPFGAERVSAAQPRAESSEVDEATLVRGALAGDRQCWQGLIARHDRKVILSLLARGVVPDRARDLAQETWTRLMENQRAGRLERLVLPALAIVQAGFLAASQWRRENRQGFGVSADEGALRARLDDHGDHGESGTIGRPDDRLDDRLIDRQRLHRIAGALGQLPARSRQVFEFVYQHPEMDYARAAQHLGLSVQRVKQIVCDVRKQLRAALQEEGP